MKNKDNQVYAALGQSIVAMQRELGFGSLAKRDMELMIFHHMRQLSVFDGLDNYGLANALKVPESRIKTLRLAAFLKHDAADRDAILKRVFARLADPKHHPQVRDQQIEISVEDPVERRELEKALKDIGSHADYRFNAELLRVDPVRLLALMSEYLGSSAQRQMNDLLSTIAIDDKANAEQLKQAKTWGEKLKALKDMALDGSALLGTVISAAQLYVSLVT